MDQFTRRIIGFGVHAGDVDGIALCRMFNAAISTQGVPHYLSSDNDPLFQFHRWQANRRILGIEKIKSIPYTPVSHPFVERLIGTIRREYLDRTFFWNTLDLERKLDTFLHSLLAMEGRSPRPVVPGRRQAVKQGRRALARQRPCCKPHPSAVKPVWEPWDPADQRGVGSRGGRRAAGAHWLSRWRVDFGDWEVPKSFTR